MTILVAEDDEAIRRLLQGMLERDGHLVLCARDASEALAISFHHPGRLDLLVSDIDMPRMDGIALCVAIREVRAEISVLLTDFEIPAGRAKPPFAHFLRKPFTPADLLAAVGALSGRT